MTLRYLAGGSHHDIGFSSAPGTLYRMVDDVLDAVNACARLDAATLRSPRERGR